MNLKTVTIADLKPHPQNPNTHPAKQIDALAQSLDTFTQVKNVVIWNGILLAGHALVEAAIKSGRLTLEAVDVSHWPEDKATSFMLADIRTPGMAIVDEAAMAEVLRAIDEPLDIPGVDEDFLAGLPGFEPVTPAEPPEPQIDKAAELQEKWGTKLGQIWQLGNHRVACGDCTDREIVKKVMNGERADMVFTDPPYNVASETSVFAKDAPTHYRSSKGIAEADWDNDFNISSFLEILPLAMNNNYSVYICTSHHLIGAIWDWMRLVSKFYSYCVWCKPNPSPSLSKRQWTWATELIAYAVIGKHTFNYPDGTHALNWWEIIVPRHTTEHPTEKPIAIPEQAIVRSSATDDIIYNPFLGSGTTLIACENLDRRCRGIEIDPGYVAVTLERFQTHTGIESELI